MTRCCSAPPGAPATGRPATGGRSEDSVKDIHKELYLYAILYIHIGDGLGDFVVQPVPGMIEPTDLMCFVRDLRGLLEDHLASRLRASYQNMRIHRKNLLGDCWNTPPKKSQQVTNRCNKKRNLY